MLTEAQIEYLRGASPFEVGRKYGIKGLEEIGGDFEKKAFYLALKGEIRDVELLKGILFRNELPGSVRRYFQYFLEKGFDRGVVYSSLVSCLGFDYLPEQVTGFEEFMTTRYVFGYRLRYAMSARTTFRKVIYPEWKEFLPLIEEGVRLRIKHSHKKKSIFYSIKKGWKELGEVLIQRILSEG